MKYSKKEIIISTICEEEISETSDKISLLETLKKNRAEFSITIKSTINYQEKFTNYGWVRITDIKDGKLNLLNITKRGNLAIKGINLEDVYEITVLSDKAGVFYKKDEVGRMDLLDI